MSTRKPFATIDIIDHSEQRYNTIGDWYTSPGGGLHIKVSDLGSVNMNILVAVHELVEAVLCLAQGVDEENVTLWDKSYKGPYQEPGDDPDAPYHKQHVNATDIECSLAHYLGVDWDAYSFACLALSHKKEPKVEAASSSPPNLLDQFDKMQKKLDTIIECLDKAIMHLDDMTRKF